MNDRTRDRLWFWSGVVLYVGNMGSGLVLSYCWGRYGRTDCLVMATVCALVAVAVRETLRGRNKELSDG
jgi:hypothetical protein